MNFDRDKTGRMGGEGEVELKEREHERTKRNQEERLRKHKRQTVNQAKRERAIESERAIERCESPISRVHQGGGRLSV